MGRAVLRNFEGESRGTECSTRTRGNYASLRFDFNLLFCFLQAHLAYEFYQNQIQIVIYRPKLKE